MTSISSDRINNEPSHHSSKADKSSTLPLRQNLIGGKLGAPTQIFISYRRQDSAPEATHLRASLVRRFGAEQVFLDTETIKPGQDFVARIDQAIAATNIFIALIGPRWLTIKRSDGKRRLDDPNDFVRLEIESALRQGVTVIPVLVGGAKMPARKDLPAAIADLAQRNAYELPWHEGIAKLGRRIAQIEREREVLNAAKRDKRERVDLTRGGLGKGTPAIVTEAMEMSLRSRGYKVSLDYSDYWKSLKKIVWHPETYGFQFNALVYVIDFVGVKAKGSSARYIARSYPLTSVKEVPAQLKLKRPVLVGIVIYDSWFQKSASKTGFVKLSKDDRIQGATIMAIVGWNPAKKEFKLLTPWPKWGNQGIATLPFDTAVKSISDQLRSIEPVLLSGEIDVAEFQRMRSAMRSMRKAK